MTTTKNIQNLAELHIEMSRVKADYLYREVQLKNDTKAYFKQFTLGNLFKKYATPNGLLKLDEKTHISSKLMSIVLPLLMNSTFFRGSGFITKALAALVSRNVGKSLNAESLSGIFNFVKSIFKGKKAKQKQEIEFADYGIPPDSETY